MEASSRSNVPTSSGKMFSSYAGHYQLIVMDVSKLMSIENSYFAVILPAEVVTVLAARDRNVASEHDDRT